MIPPLAFSLRNSEVGMLRLRKHKIELYGPELKSGSEFELIWPFLALNFDIFKKLKPVSL